ncbi:hypothetical protein ACFV9W_22265 [Streptomyces sp. NPDC059897]|uniref:hypothetical protein n=1 Tax=Streptomyces sp. NPDC059897 TaxID=3346994 RepID=UPI003654CE67
MNLRRTTTTRRALAAATVAAGLVLSVTGCGGDGDKGEGDDAKSSAPAQQGSDGKSKPSAPATDNTLTEVKSNGITLAVTSATRDQGGFLNITGTVTNGTSALWLGTDWKSDETELQGNGGSIAGASLVDQEGKKKYLVLRDTQGRCLCTKFEGGIDQGKSTDWFAQFPAPPEGTKSVQLQVPTMPPAQLTISEGE